MRKSYEKLRQLQKKEEEAMERFEKQNFLKKQLTTDQIEGLDDFLLGGD